MKFLRKAELLSKDLEKYLSPQAYESVILKLSERVDEYIYENHLRKLKDDGRGMFTEMMVFCFHVFKRASFVKVGKVFESWGENPMNSLKNLTMDDVKETQYVKIGKVVESSNGSDWHIPLS